MTRPDTLATPLGWVGMVRTPERILYIGPPRGTLRDAMEDAKAWLAMWVDTLSPADSGW